MYVLDTNLLSELRKVHVGKADGRVARWAGRVATAHLFLSAITIYETEMGALLAERKDPAQGAVFRAWLDGYVLSAFQGRTLPVDQEWRSAARC